MNRIKIANYTIGPGQPCFIIAEAGVNHNGDMEIARRLVEAAAQAGADAVKFQTFTAERIVTPDACKADYQLQTTDTDESHYEMLKRLELSAEMHQELIVHCRNQDILFLSTPFDERSADFLEELGIAAFKIPSGEITNLPFLAHVARKGKPMIVSTGMSCLGEVETAVQTIKDTGNQDLILLHSVSNYPADPSDINLRAMQTLTTAFKVPVGYSDHTEGSEVAIAAVALGACLIEKHFTEDRNLPGPDHRASLEPEELKTLVNSIRTVETALGHGRKEPAASEANTAKSARKSLVSALKISAGTKITRDMIKIKRPGTGIAPTFLPTILGMKINRPLDKDEVLRWEHF